MDDQRVTRSWEGSGKVNPGWRGGEGKNTETSSV